MRLEREGGAVVWLVGTLEVQSVQAHGLTPLQELWPYQRCFFFFGAFCSWRSEDSLASLSP